MKLEVLNADNQNTFHYLPYGVSTLEMKLEEDGTDGFLYPDLRSNGSDGFHVGYADQGDDFLVIWGGGSEKGLHVNRLNVKGRLFLQILHKGNKIEESNISLCHSEQILPLKTIKLTPFKNSNNLARMKMEQGSDYYTISFAGSMLPLYYKRWFPPRPSRNETIHYKDIEIPDINIQFSASSDQYTNNICSDINVIFDGKNIAEITGDLRYSWPHAELFTFLGDSDYLVLRLWLYWLHTNFSKNPLLSASILLEEKDEFQQDEETRRRIWELFDVESPDMERFDFLIDTKSKKVKYVGTDYHYQELWYKFDDAYTVKARIANDINTMEQVMRRLKNLRSPPENYDPVDRLKLLITNTPAEKELVLEKPPQEEEYDVTNFDAEGNVTRRRAGFTRKHIPYARNGLAVANLVSSRVTF